MTNKKRVLVVDDSAFMRSIITRLIEKDDRLEVLDVAKDGVEAVEKACRLKPDVITMDIEMPNKNGLEALAEIMEKCPTRVMMVSSLTKEGAQETMRALELGAVDFFPKSMDDNEKSIFAKGEILQEKIFNVANISNISKVLTPESRVSESDVQVQAQHQPNPQSGSLLRFKQAEIAFIGISTGGPKALHSIMPNFSETLRVPLVIAQHMPPNFTAAMANRLNQLCKLTVLEAQDGMKLEPNHIYIAPGGSQCEIERHLQTKTFKIHHDEGSALYKPSVEVLAKSIHQACHGNVLAVMMTGMGNDGIIGFEALKKSGAYIIAQDEATCVVYGMPKAVVQKGLANEILPLSQIPHTLDRLLN